MSRFTMKRKPDLNDKTQINSDGKASHVDELLNRTSDITDIREGNSSYKKIRRA